MSYFYKLSLSFLSLKKKLLFVLLFAFSASTIFFQERVYALYNEVTLSNTVLQVSGVSLLASGAVESLTVNASNIVVVLAPGSTLNLSSPDKKVFSVVVQGTATHTEDCNTSDSSLVFTSPPSRATSTISVSGFCGTLSVPNQVSGIAVVNASGQSSLSWTAPSSNGSAILDYLVEYKLSTAQNYTLFNDGVSTSLSATITGLVDGLQYSARVSALNSLGLGASSSPVTLSPQGQAATSSTQATVQSVVYGGGGGYYSSLTSNQTVPTTQTTTKAVTQLNNEVTSQANEAASNTNESSSAPQQISGFAWKGVRSNDVVALQKILEKEGVFSPAKTDVVGYYGNKTEKAVKDFQCKYKIVCSGTPRTTGWGIVGSKTKEVLNKMTVTSSLSQEGELPSKAQTTTRETTQVVPVSTNQLSTTESSSAPQQISGFAWKGVRSNDVVALQKILEKEGVFSPAKTDVVGYYGNKTEKAVKDFQCKYKIVCSGTPRTTGWGIVGSKTKEVLNTVAKN